MKKHGEGTRFRNPSLKDYIMNIATVVYNVSKMANLEKGQTSILGKERQL
jgi:hypothetical protein